MYQSGVIIAVIDTYPKATRIRMYLSEAKMKEIDTFGERGSCDEWRNVSIYPCFGQD